MDEVGASSRTPSKLEASASSEEAPDSKGLVWSMIENG